MRTSRKTLLLTWLIAGVLAPGFAPGRAAETIPISPLHLEIPVGPRLDEQYGAKAAVKRMMAMHGRAQPENDEDLTNLSLEQLLNLPITTINVLGGHTHPKGQMMVGYHYMLMDMSGYLDGSDRISNRRVLERFPTIHTEMCMEMHMLELMYAPSNNVTLMAMVPYRVMNMQHLNRAGRKFATQSKGFGDVQVMALYTFLGDQRKRGNRLLLNAGLSLPSGSINKRDTVPGSGLVKLEYPMQLGSGTVDLLPGLTYLGDSEHWAWGAQALGTVHLGENSNNYTFGDQVHLTAWGVYRIKDWVAPSVRLLGSWSGEVRGRDIELNPLGNPESNPPLQGG